MCLLSNWGVKAICFVFPAAFADTLQSSPLPSLHNLNLFILCIADTIMELEKGHTAENEASVYSVPTAVSLESTCCLYFFLHLSDSVIQSLFKATSVTGTLAKSTLTR